jgi:putative DNA primase/helicase
MALLGRANVVIPAQAPPSLGQADSDPKHALVVAKTMVQTKFMNEGREDPSLSHRLLLELPAIFRWALEGKDRLNQRGYFLQPKSGEDDAEELADLGSPVSVFVKEMCDLGPYRTPIQDVFNAWRQWCYLIGRHPGNKASFGKSLRAAQPEIRRYQPSAAGSRERAYDGIKLKEVSAI